MPALLNTRKTGRSRAASICGVLYGGAGQACPFALVWVCAILGALPLFAAERMTVSVCSRARLDGKALLGAEATAASLFHSAGIEIVWAECEVALEGDEAAEQHWFTVRLRDGRPFLTPPTAALDTLGEAFLSADNVGYVVDVYREAVERLAASQLIDLRLLLGYVMAHELAHLLLGPGHSAKGVMHVAWDRRDLDAMRQGGLKFNPDEIARMRQVLRGAIAP